MQRISIRLKSLREERQLSVDEVAKALGIAKSVIWGNESAKKQVSVSHLQSFADFYHVSMDYILERNQSASPLEVLQLRNLNAVNVVVDNQAINEEELAEMTSYLQVKRRLKEDGLLVEDQKIK